MKIKRKAMRGKLQHKFNEKKMGKERKKYLMF